MTVKATTAGQLMTRELVTIPAHETLRTAAALMSERQLHCLFVPPAEPGRCLGILTAKDIVQILCDGDTALPPVSHQFAEPAGIVRRPVHGKAQDLGAFELK